MTYRINGCGTTMSPFPNYGEHSISMHWFTLFFLPIILLGWHLIEGSLDGKYTIIKKLSYTQVINTIGMKGMLLTIGYAYFINILLGILIFGAMAIANYYGVVGAIVLFLSVFIVILAFEGLKKE